MELPQATSPLHLPANAFQHIVLQLPDPSSLAATCHAAAALLDDDELLLDWFAGASLATAASASSPAASAVAQHRHPGYALLLWRRLHSMRTPRLAALLLRWLNRCLPASSDASDSRSRAQQLLDGGDALAALQALLPHSDHLLLQYAAQGGKTQLLGELLAAPGAAAPAQLHWDADTHTEYSALRVAVFAAVRGGHVDAMHMLLAALQASGLSQEQMAWVHNDLLSTAITTGSRSRGCLQALLQLSSTSPRMQHHLTDRLQTWLPDVTDEGMQHDLLSAVAAFPDGANKAYKIALRSGHISMAQRFKPAGMSEEQAAKRFCKAATTWISRSSSEAHLKQLAKAMLRLKRDERGGIWQDVLIAHFSSGCVAGLQAIWAEFSRPGEAAFAKPDLVDVMFLAMMISMERNPYQGMLSTAACEPGADLDSARWFGDHVAPHLSAATKRRSGSAAALMLLRNGHKELLPFVQAPAATAREIARDTQWQMAQLGGEVKWAVRQGDVGAVRAALAPLAAMDAAVGGAAAMFNQTLSAPVACRALEEAAGLADLEVAAAVVRVLAAHFDGEHIDDAVATVLMAPGVAMAQGGAFLPMVCEASPTVRGVVAGPETGSDLCWEACKDGLGGLAHWLCVQAGQRGDYLATVPPESGPERNSFTHSSARTLSSFTQLLYSLAAKGGSAPSGQQGASELGSRGSGGRSSAELDSSSSSGPPAGARQVTEKLLRAVVYSGSPDLLHALLVFVDAWGPGADTAE